jgi:gentisate 1,2-dioxygenase
MISFTAEAGRPISEFASRGSIHVPISKIDSQAHAGCIYLLPGGVVGMHPAEQRQLFMVVQGSGWVRGGNSGQVPIEAGQAVLWEAGELHGSGTETGMTAIVLEGEHLELYREQA